METSGPNIADITAKCGLHGGFIGIKIPDRSGSVGPPAINSKWGAIGIQVADAVDQKWQS